MNQPIGVVLLACAGVSMWGQAVNPAAAVGGLSLSQKLPMATRIDVLVDGKWTRGVVSHDGGPGASKVSVRIGPERTSTIVPRDALRLPARPTHIAIGDRLEWYDKGVFSYVPAFVKGIGSGRYAGQYLMVYDSRPNSGGTYSSPDTLFLPLPANEAAPAGASGAVGNGPEPGKYNCYAYGSPALPRIALGDIDLRADGSYSGRNQEGRYSYDAASRTVTWHSGWLKENRFGGKVESNAVIRLSRTGTCHHE